MLAALGGAARRRRRRGDPARRTVDDSARVAARRHHADVRWSRGDVLRGDGAPRRRALRPRPGLARRPASRSCRSWRQTDAPRAQAEHSGSVLVVAEVAAAVLVLSGAGLLLRTLDHARACRPRLSRARGADDGDQSADASPASGRESVSARQDGLRRFYEAAQREIEQSPGVRSAAWGGALPLDGMWSMQPFTVVGDTPSAGRPRSPRITWSARRYFETLNIPIVNGRGFTRPGHRDSAPVCIVSEAFVRRFLGNRDPDRHATGRTDADVRARAAPHARDRRRRTAGQTAAQTR